ncbi:tetratricopeptide repeat protein (macronuclear) [Tetrahymena thermophila SB210]|uniref:Tetratricopeptide repeat protein n=1 Tax=Tetrahymena thermophila (strain SB210) TaxID=312017 RepID=Q23EA5_TETTS|nr:tetratricopeptide repeat protein [Tetrahymena thermophila SB210]EAR94848.1 tetratricopeptide repeat protein [Tetrahymena thermophila SB210]|eukprot:XP_001015093.1 tetratricopeptide repeat protein [Tetrahymena thermophila SB210]
MNQEFINNSIFTFFYEKKQENFRGSLDDIEKQIDKILQLQPKNIRSLLIKAQILYKYKLQFDEALRILQIVIQIDKINIDARLDIIQICILKKLKNIQQQQFLLDECFQLDNLYWRNLYIQCIFFFHQEKVDDVFNIAKQQIDLMPYNYWLMAQMAQIYSDRKMGTDLEESKQIVDKIMKEEEKDFEIMIRLAYTYINLQENELTEQLLTKALELNPNSTKAYNNYGYLLRVNKDYQKSIDMCQKAIILDSNYLDAIYNAACSYFNLQDYENSVKLFKKCTQINRQKLNSYQELAYIYMELIKEENSASYYLSKFPKQFPNDEYGNNLYVLHQFRQFIENKPIDLEQAEYTQFSNINRIKKKGSCYPFITYKNSQSTLNYLYNE